MRLLREHDIVVCVGETGSGKTTQIRSSSPTTRRGSAAARTPRSRRSRSRNRGASRPFRRAARRARARRRARRRGELPHRFDDCGAWAPRGGRAARRACERQQRRRQRRQQRRHGGGEGGGGGGGDQRRGDRHHVPTDGCLVRECVADPLLRRYRAVADEATSAPSTPAVLFGAISVGCSGAARVRRTAARRAARGCGCSSRRRRSTSSASPRTLTTARRSRCPAGSLIDLLPLKLRRVMTKRQRGGGRRVFFLGSDTRWVVANLRRRRFLTTSFALGYVDHAVDLALKFTARSRRAACSRLSHGQGEIGAVFTAV